MKKQTVVAVVSLILSAAAFDAATAQSSGDRLPEQVRQNSQLMVEYGVPEEPAMQMVQAMVQQQVREENIVRAQQMVMNAHRQDLPVEPMISKAMEGLAKGVPSENVLQAMEQVQNRYSVASRHAAQLTAEPADRQRLRNMIADCLTAGIRNEDLDRIMEQLQQRSRQMSRNQAQAYALSVMQNTRTMARMSVRSSAAADVVCAALQNRYSTREMNQLHQQFMRQSQTNSPDQLAAQYARAIAGGERGGNLGKADSGSSAAGGSHSAGGAAGSGGGPGGGNSGGGGSGGPGGSGGHGK